MNTQAELEVFWENVKSTISPSLIPEVLKVKCNEEFRAYLEGRAQGSGYYMALASMVHWASPENVLELGTNLGASAIALYAQKKAGARLVTVDIDTVARALPDEMLEAGDFWKIVGNDVDFPLIKRHDENLFDAIYGKVDFLFIDTDHRAEHLRNEWEIYQRYLVPGALVVLDDINVNDMRGFWDALPYPKLDITDTCHYSGFGIFIYTP